MGAGNKQPNPRCIMTKATKKQTKVARVRKPTATKKSPKRDEVQTEGPASATGVPGTMVVKLELRYTKSIREVVLPVDMRMIDFLNCTLCLFGFANEHLSTISSFKGMFPSINPFGETEESLWPEEFEELDEKAWQDDLEFHLPAPKAKCTIEYDFGDGWEIKVTRMADRPALAPFSCVKTVGTDAMENCGGVGGLDSICQLSEKVLKDGDKGLDKDDKSLLGWAFGTANPLPREAIQRFLAGPDVAVINARLARASYT